MANNDRLHHPYDDANPSTSSSDRPEPVVRQLENDLMLSSNSNPVPNSGQRVGAVPFVSGDSDYFPGAGAQQGTGAIPFGSNGEVPVRMYRGPVQEEPSLSTDRLVEEIHFGKIVSLATKALNRDLIRAAQFNDHELNHITSLETRRSSRREVCSNILFLWKHKGGNSQKNIFDLKVLLTKAGEPDNKYWELINDIVHNFP